MTYLAPVAPPVPVPSRDAAPAILAKDNTEDFHLDPAAPIRAAKERSSSHAVYIDAEGIRRWDAAVGESTLESVKEEEEHTPLMSDEGDKGKSKADGDAEEEAKEDGPSWGESFRVEWIRTTRMPFYRTRQLRNPWNSK